MTVNSGSCLGGLDMGDDKSWPPGFRFHPTDEELILYYLKKKMCRRRLRLDIIRELDVYKWDPVDLPGQSILKTGDRQWFFFSPRDRKYPNGARSNRATGQGYWKATGRDRNITCNSRAVGVKKTLVFYRGRAPNGERTDWVMHEYTLDEEELRRCPNVKDYYALYKVYKKSGPGPKNGEQYGALFNEEEWDDDEIVNRTNFDATVKQPVISPPPVNHNKSTAQVELPSSAYENFMDQFVEDDSLDLLLKQIAHENPQDLLPVDDLTSNFSQVTGDEETQSTLVDPSNKEVTFGEPSPVAYTICQPYDLQANLDFNQSATSTLDSLEAPEVISFPENCEQAPRLHQEDFLEIDDLSGPEPTSDEPEYHAENVNFDDFNELGELDMFHDAAMFLREMGPVGQETVTHVNEVDFQLQLHSMADQVDYQLAPHLSGGNMDYLQAGVFDPDPLWVHDPTDNVCTTNEANPGTLSEKSPGVNSETVNDHPFGANKQKQSAEEEAGRSGWISSTLWGFVESIPTKSASASERPLVNKAFERMSSFSRMKMSIKNSNINSGNLSICNANANASTSRTGGSGNKGFILISILGVVCAILWVLVGALRVLGRAIFS